MASQMSEQETIVRWDRESDEMNVYTHSKAAANRLKNAGAKVIRVSERNGKSAAWTLSCPKTWFRWPRPRRKRVRVEKQLNGAGI